MSGSFLVLMAMGLTAVISGCSGGGSHGSSPSNPTGPSNPSSPSTPTPGAANAVSLGTATVGDSANPVPASITVDGSGNTAVAWVDPSGQVNVSTLASGASTWSKAVGLIPATSLAKSPAQAPVQILSDASGNLTVICELKLSGTLLASSLPKGASAWTAPVLLPTNDGSSTFHAAMLPNGNVEVAYESSNNTLDMAAFDVQSQSWGTPQTLSIPNGVWEFNLAVTPQGGVAVVWTSDILPNQDPSQQDARGIYASTAPGSTGPFSTPVEIDKPTTPNGQVEQYPSLISDAQGNITAVWENNQQNAGSEDLYANRLAAGSTTWGAPVKLDSTSDSIGPYDGYPAPMVAETNGDVEVAWVTDEVNQPNRVEVATYSTAQGSWGAPVTVQTMTMGEPVGSPALTLGPSTGELSVFWNGCANSACSSGSGGGDIYQNIYQSGSWGTYIQADLPSSANQATTFPVAASTQNGSAVVLWGVPTSTKGAYTLYANVLN